MQIYIGNMDPATTAEQIEAAIRECMGQDIPIMSGEELIALK